MPKTQSGQIHVKLHPNSLLLIPVLVECVWTFVKHLVGVETTADLNILLQTQGEFEFVSALCLCVGFLCSSKKHS